MKKMFALIARTSLVSCGRIEELQPFVSSPRLENFLSYTTQPMGVKYCPQIKMWFHPLLRQLIEAELKYK